MKDILLKISWQERARLSLSQEEIKKYFNAYHLSTEESPIDFINRWVLTYDPRRKIDKVLPLELFPKQDIYIRWLWDRYISDTSGVVDKCRTAGASWVTIAFFVYMFLFQKDVSLQVYSYKAEEVHKLGDISTLLQKAVFIIDHLPLMFTQGVKCSHMYLKNSRMGSDIAGSSGDNPGRGSRRTMIMTDEEAFYERAELVEAALSETSNCRISVSTHSGTTSLFYRKCQTDMPKHIFEWWDDSRNDQEWYDKKRQDAIDKGLLHIFEREINRNAAASLESVVVPSEWVNSAKRTDVDELKKLGIDLHGKRIAALDPANEGGDLHGLVIMNGNIPVYAEESGEGDPGDATDLFFWKAVEYKVEEFRYDPIGVGAGVKVRIKEILSTVEKDNNISDKEKKRILAIKIIPWSASGAVMRPNEEDMKGIKNSRMFENIKAQTWWRVREEFRNTYRYINNKEHDISQIVKLPDGNNRALNKMIMEISQPQYKMSASGKTMIDKKPKGTQSPNLADSYIMCRAEVKKDFIPWDVI